MADIANYKVWGHAGNGFIVTCRRCQAPFLDVVFQAEPDLPTAAQNRDLASIVAAAEAHEAEVHA